MGETRRKTPARSGSTRTETRGERFSHARGADKLQNGIWPAAVAYVSAFLLVVCASEAVMLGVGAVRAAGKPESIASEGLKFTRAPAGVTSSALVSATLFSAVALAAARFETRDVVARLGLRKTGATRVGFVAAALGMMGLSLASGAAIDLVGRPNEGTMNLVAHALERPSPLALVLAMATLALAPAFAEEMLFRGYIQGRLARSWGRWPSILVASVGFGLIHLDAAQGVAALVAGVYLGALAQRFGGIRPGIAAHAINNATFVAAASFDSAEHATRGANGALLALGAVICAASWSVVRSAAAVRARQ